MSRAPRHVTPAVRSLLARIILHLATAGLPTSITTGPRSSRRPGLRVRFVPGAGTSGVVVFSDDLYGPEGGKAGYVGREQSIFDAAKVALEAAGFTCGYPINAPATAGVLFVATAA